MRCISLFFMLAPNLALADYPRIFSGEHGAFTRLYIETLENPISKIDELPNEVVIYLDEFQDFDYSRIWDRISRKRIGSIESSEDSLLIGVKCECHVKYYIDRDLGIIVDFYEGPAENDSFVEYVRIRGGDSASSTISSGETSGPVLPPSSSHSVLPFSSRPYLLDARAWETSKGASDGFQTWMNSVWKPTDPQIVSTSSISSPRCPDDSKLSPNSWGVSADYYQHRDHHQFERVQEGIFEEESTLALVQHQLFHGFDLEALAFIEGSNIDSEDIQDLQAIGSITAFPSSNPIPSHWRECGPNAQLWHILSQGTIGEFSDTELDRISQAFLELPSAMREATLPSWSAAVNQSSATRLLASVSVASQTRNEELRANLDTHTKHRVSAGQLAKLISGVIDEEGDISNDIMELSSAALFEEHDLEKRLELSQARFKAAIYIADFSLARVILDQELLTDGEYYDAAREDYYLALARAGDEDAFLREAFSADVASLEGEAQSLVQSRLHDLGFGTMASDPLHAVRRPTLSENSSAFLPERDLALAMPTIAVTPSLEQAHVELLNANSLISEVETILGR